MRKSLIAIAVLGLSILAVWAGIGGMSGLVEAALPKFPDYPPPTTELTEGMTGQIYYATRTPFDLDVILEGMEDSIPTTGLGTLFVPTSASAVSPVPAMVVLHGSGGITAGREMEYGELLAQNGIAAFVIDYYSPRGITDATNYMMRVLSVTEFDAVADSYAALQLLATHPAIDGDRIGVMGFSYGGMATRIAMDERVRAVLTPERRGFAAFVDYYGPCFQDFRTTAVNGAPLLTLRGTDDASNDLAACLDREAQMTALGVDVEAHVYEGAGHAWEAQIPREFHDVPYVAGCTVVYDENGHSSVNGISIVDPAPGASRSDRIAIRIESGQAMRDCVKGGYLVGRDDATKEKSDAALLTFLRRAFAMRDHAARAEPQPIRIN